MTPVNKFTIEVEEMGCKSCGEITGHVLIKNKWLCVICGKSPRKNKQIGMRRFRHLMLIGPLLLLALDWYMLKTEPEYMLLNVVMTVIDAVVAVYMFYYWWNYDKI